MEAVLGAGVSQPIGAGIRCGKLEKWFLHGEIQPYEENAQAEQHDNSGGKKVFFHGSFS